MPDALRKGGECAAAGLDGRNPERSQSQRRYIDGAARAGVRSGRSQSARRSWIGRQHDRTDVRRIDRLHVGGRHRMGDLSLRHRPDCHGSERRVSGTAQIIALVCHSQLRGVLFIGAGVRWLLWRADSDAVGRDDGRGHRKPDGRCSDCSAQKRRLDGGISKTEHTTGIPIDPKERFLVHSNADTTKIVLMNRRGLSCGGAEITLTEPPKIPSYSGMAAYAPRSNALYERMRAAHRGALIGMQNELLRQADRYVLAIRSETKPPFALDVINAAALRYENTIQRVIQSSSGAMENLSNLIESNLKRDGWIMMGAWYQTFAQENAQATSMANATAVGIPGTDPNLIPYKDMYDHVSVVYAHQMRQAVSIASPQALANHLSVGTTDPKSYLSKIFPGQKLVQMAVRMNSGQGPSGMTNPL